MKYLDSHSLDAAGVWTLWMAVRCGKLAMAKLLIEQGAHIDDAILHTAKQYGHTELVEFLRTKLEKQND